MGCTDFGRFALSFHMFKALVAVHCPSYHNQPGTLHPSVALRTTMPCVLLRMAAAQPKRFFVLSGSTLRSQARIEFERDYLDSPKNRTDLGINLVGILPNTSGNRFYFVSVLTGVCRDYDASASRRASTQVLVPEQIELVVETIVQVDS